MIEKRRRAVVDVLRLEDAGDSKCGVLRVLLRRSGSGAQTAAEDQDMTAAVSASPGEFTAYLKSEVERWSAIVRDAKITID